MIQRYGHEHNVGGCGECPGFLVPRDDGDYVTINDHRARVAELERKVGLMQPVVDAADRFVTIHETPIDPDCEDMGEWQKEGISIRALVLFVKDWRKAQVARVTEKTCVWTKGATRYSTSCDRVRGMTPTTGKCDCGKRIEVLGE